jgi:hypothetical protein
MRNLFVDEPLTCFVSKHLQFASGKGLTENYIYAHGSDEHHKPRKIRVVNNPFR